MSTESPYASRISGATITVSTALHDTEWDQFVFQSDDGHYTQTALWSEVKTVQGWSPLRIVFKDKEGILCGAQILLRKLPLFGFMGYISKGPVCPTCDLSLCSIVLQEVFKVCKQYQIAYLAIQPPDHGDEFTPLLIEMGMGKSTQGDLEKPATILIDLRPDEDGILAQIKGKRRRYVRQSQKQGFTLTRGERKDLQIFSRLHENTGDRSGFEIQSQVFFEKLWDVFHPLGYIELLIEKYEEEAVTAYLILEYNKIGYGFRIGWTGEHRKKYPNEYAIWNGLLWAKARGCETFDLGGIDTEAAEALLAGLPVPDSMHGSYTEYKLHYSENVVMYPETYEKTLNPALNLFYRVISFSPAFNRIVRKIYKMSRQR